MKPSEVIEITIKHFEHKYNKELFKIDSLISQSKYTGGKLIVKLDCAFIPELIPILNIVYKARGWDKVNIWNDHSGEKSQTIVELEYN